jgi:antitoxin VapB
LNHKEFADIQNRSRDIQTTMPLYIKDGTTAILVAELPRHRGVTKQDPFRQAAQAELDRIKQATPLRERLEAFWRDNPLPPPTGNHADKATLANKCASTPAKLPLKT